MPRRISSAELRILRNELPIRDVLLALELPSKQREGHFRFLCPLCLEFHTDLNPDTNLARCFRCERNFNSIDIVMIVERLPFLDAVAILRRLYTPRAPATDPTPPPT